MSVVKSLQNKIYKLTSGMFATWMPDERVSIGDFGYLTHGRFIREGSVHTRGVEFATFREKSDGTLQYSDGVKISTGARAAAKLPAHVTDASGVIEFTKEGAFAYHFSDSESEKIDDRQMFLRRLLNAILSGQLHWQDHYVVADEIRRCTLSTILISEMSSGLMRLKGGGEISEQLNLAHAHGSLDLSTVHGSILNFSGRKDTQPFYHVIKLKFSGGPTGGTSPLRKLWEWLGGRTPAPEEIDITTYKGSDTDFNVDVTRHDRVVASFIASFSSASLDDLFDEMPFGDLRSPVEEIEVEAAADEQRVRNRTADA